MAILVINRTDSKCGSCGKSANLYEDRHTTVLGWDEPTTGCGEPWDGVESDYINMHKDFIEDWMGNRFPHLIGLPVYNCGDKVGLFGGKTRENATLPKVPAFDDITILEAESVRELSGKFDNSKPERPKGLPSKIYYVRIVASNGNKLGYGKKGGGKYTKRSDAEYQTKHLKSQGFDARMYETDTLWREVSVD